MPEWQEIRLVNLKVYVGETFSSESLQVMA